MTVLYKKAVSIIAGIAIQTVLAAPLHAQQAPTATLQSIIDSAQKHLPVLLEKQALISSANAAITDAQHQRLPLLRALDEVTAASANSMAGAYFPMGTIPSVSGSIRGSNSLQASMGNTGMLYSEYNIFDFGLNKALVQNAKAFAGVAQSDFDRQLYLLKWQAGKTYFDLLRNEYQLNIDAQNVRRYQDIFKVIQAVTLAGIRPGADSSQVIAELSNTRISYNITEGKVKQLQQELSYYTGMSPESINIDTARSFSRPVAAPISETLDTARNPFLSFYTAQTNYYRANQQLINKSYQPRVVLLGGVWGRGSSIRYNDDYKSMTDGLGYQRFNYAVGVSFVYNLFDAVHRRDKLAVNEYKTVASDLELQEQQQALLNQLQQANTAINTNEKNLQEMPIQLKAAQDVFSQKLAQYNAGTINLIDLTTASYALYRAQTSYLEVLNDWYLSNLNKAAVTGNLDQFIQTIKK